MNKQATLIRTSERSSFTTCRWAWDLGYNRRLKPLHPAVALRFGTLVHRSLANYYRVGTKRGPHPKKTFLRLYKKDTDRHDVMGVKDEDGKWVSLREVGAYMFEGYIEKYGEDSEWDVLATEMPFQFEVHHPRTGRYLFTYVGTLDGVWQHVVTKEVWIPDHKTTGSDPTKLDNFWIDEQSGSYWTFGVDALRELGIIKPKHDLRGMLYNLLLKAARDERPRDPSTGLYLNKPTKEELLQGWNNHFLPGHGPPPKTVAELMEAVPNAVLLGSPSKQQPPPRFERRNVYRSEHSRGRQRQRIIDQAHEMHLTRRGKLAAYKIPGPLHNPHCRGCPYRDACELDEEGADYQPILDNMIEWDPYSEHSLYERN